MAPLKIVKCEISRRHSWSIPDVFICLPALKTNIFHSLSLDRNNQAYCKMKNFKVNLFSKLAISAFLISSLIHLTLTAQQIDYKSLPQWSKQQEEITNYWLYTPDNLKKVIDDLIRNKQGDPQRPDYIAGRQCQPAQCE